MKDVYSKCFVPIFLLLFSSGCYKISTEDFVNQQQQKRFVERQVTGKPLQKYYSTDLEDDAAKHWLYHVIPRHRSQLAFYDVPRWVTWGLFGNDDDGIFGEAESAAFKDGKEINGNRALHWGTRNPFHNFSFYVIGTAYCQPQSEFALLSLAPEKVRVFKYQSVASTVFPSERSGMFLGFHGWKPFFSLRLRYTKKRQFELYCGWREKGNFGLKFRPIQKHYTQEKNEVKTE